VLKRLIWLWTCDRLGPDIPLTHALLYFKRSMRWICRKKFRHFGESSEFRPFAYAIQPSKISIGDNVIIRPGSMLFAEDGEIEIEDDAAIGAGVHFYVNNHRFDRIDIPIKYQGYSASKLLRVCRGAWIGANAILLSGVTIGQNAVVGAGSIVTSDVPPFTVVAGNPARVIQRTSPRSAESPSL
jgi:acetyltransferase-like isoleucine patch superfamily enzyme